MEPGGIKFGGGVSDTLLHPLVAAMLLLAIVLILVLPRKYAIAPLLLTIFFVPRGQVLVLAGAHFTVARMLILAGLTKKVTSARPQRLAGSAASIDRMVILWALSLLLIFSLQWMDTKALIKSLGDLLDALGGYFVLRFLIQDREDVVRTIKVLALVAIGSAIFMIGEQITGSNVFAYLGGMPPETTRDGKVRSQAAFEVFITAGTYGATLLPLLIWLWSDVRTRVFSLLGIIGATVMVLTCHASTTLSAYGAGIFALCLWPLRKSMRLLRWGLAFTLVALHLVMHGPVWSLIEKVDLTGSSSSYHRYMLIDNCIRHFSDWWLLGYRDYANWGFDMWDLSDQYVGYAVTGGLLTLVLFVAIISRAFASIGNARKAVEGDTREEWFLWCLGAALFSHVVAYFGIGYFDQMEFAWFTHLAIICFASSDAIRSSMSAAREQIAPLRHEIEVEAPVGWGALDAIQ